MVALQEPETREVFARRRRRAWLLTMVGLAAFTTAAVLISIASDRQEDLEGSEIRVDGIVIDVSTPIRGPSTIKYEYSVGEKAFTNVIYGSNAYDVGEAVDVFVDPADPTNSTVPGEQPQSVLAYWITIIGITAGLSLLIAGVGQVRSTRRRRNVLARAPWRSQRYRLSQEGRLWSRLEHAEDLGRGRPGTIRLATRELRRVRPYLGGPLWVAAHGRRVVLAPSGEPALTAIGRV